MMNGDYLLQDLILPGPCSKVRRDSTTAGNVLTEEQELELELVDVLDKIEELHPLKELDGIMTFVGASSLQW